MQTLSNIMGVPIKVAAAQQAMGQGELAEYKPNEDNLEKYNILYNRYKKLSDFLETE